MAIVRRFWPVGAALFLIVSMVTLAQQRSEEVQATAFGTSTQLGRTFNVNITITSYSTPQDQQVLLEAFQKGGNRGLVDALQKMPARGRISMPGVLGYEIKYARVWSTPTGRKLRLVTDRTIAMRELIANTRSRDYSVTAVELELNNDKEKSSGTLLPACELKLNKQNEIELEAYQNPWRLGNFIDWSK